MTIYILDGEDFILPVHATRYNKDNFKWDFNSNLKTMSISLIGSNCLGVFRNPKEAIILGFSKLNIKDIMHIYHTDSYSKKENSSEKINEIYMPNELLSKTYQYNEILIAQNILNNEKLKPDYLVCYDEVTDNEIKIAKELNIKIVLIMAKCYKQHDFPMFDDKDDYYIKNLNDLFLKNMDTRQKQKAMNNFSF